MRYEASDQVFVAMPFTIAFQRAYQEVIGPAISSVKVNGKKLQPRIINSGTIGSPDIHEQIFDAIIHSRLVIADMTVQSNYTDDNGTLKWQGNSNVAYEVGLASAWRNPEDILLIHQANREHTYSFDLQNLRHVPYEIAESSVRLVADEIVRAINQSRFLADETFLKLVRSISPSSIQFMHIESQRVFPIIAFQSDGMPIMDSRIHAITELLSLGALKNRNVLHLGKDKGVNVIYQWTDLGLRMLRSTHSIDTDRHKELRELISSVPENSLPSRELLEFPKLDFVSAEFKQDSSQKG
jgi:hypothetical protein